MTFQIAAKRSCSLSTLRRVFPLVATSLLSACGLTMAPPPGPGHLRVVCSTPSPTTIIYENGNGHVDRVMMFRDDYGNVTTDVRISVKGGVVQGRYNENASGMGKPHLDYENLYELATPPNPVDLMNEIVEVGQTAINTVYYEGKLPGHICQSSDLYSYGLSGPGW